MALLRIQAVEPLDGRMVNLILTDGSIVERDLAPLLVGPVFHEIATSNDAFRQVVVRGGALAWPCGADLCPDMVIWGGLPPDEELSDSCSVPASLSL
jgi:hypothetical protein